MDYNELEDVYEFHRNMRRTPWEKLFPHWWDTTDALLKAIGDEVERVKATAIFALLNAGIKPPVLLWQESIEHKEYHANFNVTELPHPITIQAPLYKTWGKIIITNNTPKDLDGLTIKLDNTHGLAINQLIAQSDKLVIDLTNNRVTLNNEAIDVQKIGKGIPYYVTSARRDKYEEGTPLHNEVVRITFDSYGDSERCDMDVDVQMDNVVFTDEQNIEVTGLEAVPIERIELYAEYDFDFNKQYNGWHKVYDKVYEENTNVIYDMITTKFYTKRFYVDVYFKTLQYPYRVGFPCFKDADTDSMYHVNNRLDKWGETLGLPRRLYKEDINEKEYYRTFPIYYPFDIEQDYYYYRRLTSEYVWNDLAKNDVDILDTDNTPVARLYAIDPFIEDLVIHAKSQYPKDKEFIDYGQFKPVAVLQKHVEGIGVQTEFTNIINLISDNEKRTSITLNNKSDNNDVIYKRLEYGKLRKYSDKEPELLTEAEKQIILSNPNNTLTKEEQEQIIEASQNAVTYINSATYQSTELITYFDLSTLPSDVNINDIEVIVEGESTDNKTNKYSTDNTGLLIPDYDDVEQTFIPLIADKPYQLKKQLITYSNDDLMDYLHKIQIDDKSIQHTFNIGHFEGKIKDFVKIPFVLIENDVDVDDITDIWLYYNGNIRRASYKEEDGVKYIYCYVPNIAIMDEITIVCKSRTHYPFSCSFNIIRGNKYDEDNQKVLYQYITGPIVDGEPVENYMDTIEWHTDDTRNLIQKQGVYFRNVLKNIDEQSSTTIYQYNVYLKISYSPKQSDFTLSTYINRNNIEQPYIGEYYFTMKNVGEKSLSTHVDITYPPNIKLSENSFKVNLKPGDGFTCPPVNITPNYPIDDGFYDIVTLCEDKIRRNTIEVFSDGLIETGVSLYPHHCRYENTINLSAEVHAVDGSNINSNVAKVQFYINGYSVGTTTVHNNKAELSISPKNYSFTGSGNLPLEARFLGTTKYASSSRRSTIFVSKNSTKLTLIAEKVIPYKGSTTLQAKVEYCDGKEFLPVDKGNVTFYINDEVLSSNTTLANGIFTASINKIENPPNKYTLWARYSGTDIYAGTEESQDLEIVGGDVKVTVFDVKAKPKDIITLKAQVVDVNNKNVINGYMDFYLKDENDNYTTLSIPNFNALTRNKVVTDGLVVSDAIQLNELLSSDVDKHTYIIEAKYHYSINAQEDDLYQQAINVGTLIIEKGKVQLEYEPIFYGSQYEPLGFFVNVKDATTQEAISEGSVQISLQKEIITLEEEVDDDGGVRFVHRPLEFSAKEWHELEKFSFDVILDDLHKYYSGDTPNVLVDFIYNEHDGTLHYVGNKPNDIQDLSLIEYNEDDGKYYINMEALTERDVSDHIYITDGHLYARTTKDSLRQYNLGTQDLEIKYVSNQQYAGKVETLENGLDIQTADTDLDIHAYELYYTDNEELICYVTKYNFIDGVTTTNITTGSVQFTIDNNILDTVPVHDGQAKISNKILNSIHAGNHLIGVKYIPEKNVEAIIPTYSYSLLLLKKQQPSINLTVERETPGVTTNVYVTLLTQQSLDVPLSGTVNLFLNNECINSYYLNGNENIPGIVKVQSIEQVVNSLTNAESNLYKTMVTFKFVVPTDIDTTDYYLTATYEGNEFYLPAETDEPYLLRTKKGNVDIDIKREIYVAENARCTLDAVVTYYDDVINEGELVLMHGNEEVTSCNILYNQATLSWVPTDTVTDYTVTYRKAKQYNDKTLSITVHVIPPLSEIEIPNLNQTNIEEALMCLQPNGTIHITDDIILTKSIHINKNCKIIGDNGTSLIKDVKDLLINLEGIEVTPLSSFNSPPYRINDLSLKNLNTTDFFVTVTDNDEKQIFFKGQSGNIQIYLCDDGYFYTSRSRLNLNTALSDINIMIDEGATVSFDNLTFKSNDSDSISDFGIYNEGICKITHSIIEPTARLINKGTITAHRNLIYGTCSGQGDFDNNWWGSNTAPRDVNNHIIIQVSSKNTPAVISEDCSITGEMIGANGQKYDLPQTDFIFTADTGYFSIDSGSLTNQQITTTYLDAEEEGNVYFTVDNETVSCGIYNYEYKTEVIFDDIEDVVMNYQTSITAIVQSCADTYYEFDKNNNVIKSTQTINEGFLTFYIDNGTKEKQQIGYVPVVDGKGTIQVFFIDAIYNVDTTYNLYAEYHTDGEYFDSKAQTKIHTINEDNVCFISPNGDDNNNGKYSTPVATFSKALSLHKNTIYMLDGDYTSANIQVTENVTIKKYNGVVRFIGLTGTTLFNIQNNKIVNLSGIDFINNNYDTLISNAGQLNIEKCIFYNNSGILFTNILSAPLTVSLSAIVDNETLSDAIVPNHYSKCWFGTNTPGNNLNNYIIMTHEQSKNIIYVGTLAHVTAKLTSYKHNNAEYKLEENEKLPLRIAQFATDVGSAKPVKDYTYNNKSTSLINTLDANNTSQYIITLANDTFYAKHDVNIECHIQDVYGKDISINQDKISMHIQTNIIDIERNVDVIDGIASYSISALPVGQYSLDCVYIVNGKTYKLSTFFYVKPLDIIIDNCTIDNNSHLYYTQINATFKDNFDNNIDDELVNIRIDGNVVATSRIHDGELNTRVQYNLLDPGHHTLIIDNKNIKTTYSNNTYYEIPLIVRPQKTYINFDYDTIEADINNNLIVEINDEDNREVQSGSITVIFDDVTFAENIPISNGVASINDLRTTTGQHSIVIYYNDTSGHYKNSVYVNSALGAGIFHIQCLINDSDLSNYIVRTDIGKSLILPLTIHDIGHQKVTDGLIDIYIDDKLFSKTNRVINGLVTIDELLPVGITSGIHRLTVSYYNSNHYLDTEIYAFIDVSKIKTEIDVNTVSGPSGQQTTIKYNINSFYGAVNMGELSTYLINDEEEIFLNSTIVTDSLSNYISFIVPLLTADTNYQILFKYHDETNHYADSELITKLIINKTQVIINPSRTSYYPQQDFILNIDIKNKEGQNVDNGLIDVYLNGVKEFEEVEVYNGQAKIPLFFNTARDCTIKIAYLEDEYYLPTAYEFVFNVTNIIIDPENITFTNELSNLPNAEHTNEIVFNIPDYNIKDGIIDILFDNNLVGSYYMTENNKHIKFDIGQETKGTHKLTIKYYNSALFTNVTKDFDFTIISKNINIRINKDAYNNSQNIDALISNTINISTWLSAPITGIINYYLLIPQYRVDSLGNDYIDSYYERFIGSEDFDNEATHTNPYQYILTTDLLEYSTEDIYTHYRIKAHFIGNDEYEEAEEYVNLTIHKQDVELKMPEHMVFQYQDMITVNIEMMCENAHVLGKELLDIYIDDDFIGSCAVIDGVAQFKYRLNDKYTVGEYTLKAIFNGSAVNKGPITSTTSFTVEAFTPTLATDHMNVYILGQYTLDGIIKDKNDAIIDIGLLKYTMEDGTIIEVNPSQSRVIPAQTNTQNDWTMNVEYITGDATKYNSFNTTISISMIKNPLILSIKAPKKIYRGVPFDITLEARSNTTNAPIHLSFDRLSDCDSATSLATYDMENGVVTASVTYPISLTENSTITNCLKTSGNHIFDSAQTTFTVTTINKDYITINKSEAKSATNAHTLAKAIDLVSDYGTIEIISSLSNQTINQLSKNLTIKGEAELTNCKINNLDKKLEIKGLTFKNSKTSIYNEGELKVKECTFKNNTDSAIYTNGTATITECKFIENNTNNNGACIYVGNKSQKVSIVGCTFNGNNASLYGGCIYSNKVNDMEILNNEFAHNNNASNGGSSIYAYGNITISSNTFYDNTGRNEIYLLRGNFSIDKNLFDGKIQSIIVQQESNIDADLNYWGYSSIDDIEEHNPNIDINNHLIADCEFYKKNNKNYVVCRINKYINRLESEHNTINMLEQTFPVIVTNDSNSPYEINKEIEIGSNAQVQIGQDIFTNS